MLAALYMLTRKLWASIGLHAAWNFTQGGIYGVRVSGFYVGGLLRPAGGTALTADGRELARLRAPELARVVGSVFQQPEHQFLTGRVRDELALGQARPERIRADLDRRVADLLDRLRLTRLAEANPYTLSGGEKRRLSVATALVGRPDAVVLDEPTFGQDLRTWEELVDLLAGLRDEGVALLAATHDPAFAAALADRTLRMSAGPVGGTLTGPVQTDVEARR